MALVVVHGMRVAAGSTKTGMRLEYIMLDPFACNMPFALRKLQAIMLRLAALIDGKPPVNLMLA